MNPVEKSFFHQDAKTVAQQILGKQLIRKTSGELLSGIIVETEAYYGAEDPASRAYEGKQTKMNRWMWMDAAIVFVYMVHGHWLFNVITGKKGKPEGILIRAVEPREGVETMRDRRGVRQLTRLTSGPGKLTEAFGITKEHVGLDVTSLSSEIVVSEADDEKTFTVLSSHRSGVTRDLSEEMRFYIEGNEFVSR